MYSSYIIRIQEICTANITKMQHARANGTSGPAAFWHNEGTTKGEG